MTKHTLAHLIDDQLATIDIFFGPSELVLEPLDLALLLVLVRLELVLLLDERIACLSNLIQLTASTRYLLISLGDGSCVLLFTLLDFLMQHFVRLSSGRLEFI